MMPPTPKPPTTTKTAPDPDVLIRKEITRQLKGPVADVFKVLVPELAVVPDSYKAVMENPELLDACFRLFRVRRDAFAPFLVGGDDTPVADDKTRLKCGRSVDEIIGMVVRTGMRAYAESHFGDRVSPPKKDTAKPPPPPPLKGLLRAINPLKLGEMFRRNHGAEKTIPPGQSRSGRFYTAIKDVLDYEWQVRFFPIYVEIPSHVFEKLGIGLTRLDSEERLQRLGQLASTDIQRAETVIKEPALYQEMIENNVLASATVSELGERGFESVHSALAGIDAKKKWDIFANRETTKKLHEDRRITKLDIEALANYLDILNEYALEAMMDLHLNREQMRMFLKTAEDNLGHGLFLTLFGPLPLILPDDVAEQQKLRKYQLFCESSLRNLVTAVKQLEENLRKSGASEGEGIEQCLATVCRARRIDLEKEARKLAPASLGA